jgi:hypothetical protein
MYQVAGESVNAAERHGGHWAISLHMLSVQGLG